MFNAIDYNMGVIKMQASCITSVHAHKTSKYLTQETKPKGMGKCHYKEACKGTQHTKCHPYTVI